jgi:hypothetical protein
MAKAIQQQRKARALPLILILMALSMAALVGAGLAINAVYIVAPIALILPGVYLLVRPDISLILFTGLTLVVAGTVQYFFGLGQFQWALSALGVALLAYSIIHKLFAHDNQRHNGSNIGVSMLLWWAFVLFATAANQLPILDWLVGIRIYLPAFGIFAYLAYCNPGRDLLKKIIVFMLAIASVQWAFSLYQKMEIGPIRIASHYPGSSWDSVVGTFGGDKFGGGESGSLGIYLSIMMVLAVALKKYGQIKLLPFIIVVLTGLVAMALVESKVIALMIPIGSFFVFRDYVIRRPMSFLIGAVALGLLMLALLFAYFLLYWQTSNNLGFIDAVWQRLSYSFDPYFQATTRNFGRVKSLVFWWEHHSLARDPLTLLFGHGLATAVSSSSIIGEGLAVKQHSVALDTTGTSKLLWESGVVGFIAFLSMFVFGFLRAGVLKYDSDVPAWHRAALWGTEAAMVLMPLSVFYEVTVVSSPPMQFVAMFLLGYVAYWWRKTQGQGPRRV